MEVRGHPVSGAVTGQYFKSEDGTVSVPALMIDERLYQAARTSIAEYKWRDEDFLLESYQKNGTHFVWEIMMMLLRGNSEYIKESKGVCMIDMFPTSKADEVFPSPRVLNTHYRLDVLPKEFSGRKSVFVLRNPKDTTTSLYYHETKMLAQVMPQYKSFEGMTMSEFVRMFLYDKDVPYGSYFDYVEYIWSRRDDPNLLIVYFEDLKLDPVPTIQKMNQFMGTERSPEIVAAIADATSFSKMKQGKLTSNRKALDMLKELSADSHDNKKMDSAVKQFYRKGDIGDWKNHFTVSDNEMFDSFLEKWTVGKEIPFKY